MLYSGALRLVQSPPIADRQVDQNTLSNYVLGDQLYTIHIGLHTYDVQNFTSKFWSVSDCRKVQPPANFLQFKHCRSNSIKLLRDAEWVTRFVLPVVVSYSNYRLHITTSNNAIPRLINRCTMYIHQNTGSLQWRPGLKKVHGQKVAFSDRQLQISNK